MDTVSGVIFSPVNIERISYSDNRSFQTIILIDATYNWAAIQSDGKLLDAAARAAYQNAGY